MCEKNEEWKWKISSYHERKWGGWGAKSYEEVERTLFRWGVIVRIIPERRAKVSELSDSFEVNPERNDLNLRVERAIWIEFWCFRWCFRWWKNFSDDAVDA